MNRVYKGILIVCLTAAMLLTLTACTEKKGQGVGVSVGDYDATIAAMEQAESTGTDTSAPDMGAAVTSSQEPEAASPAEPAASEEPAAAEEEIPEEEASPDQEDAGEAEEAPDPEADAGAGEGEPPAEEFTEE